MGASSSIIYEKNINMKNGKFLELNGTIYKQTKCGCIYESDYKNFKPYNIKLRLPCFSCFQSQNQNNEDMITNMLNILTTNDIKDLLSENFGWLTQEDAIQYAKINGINIIEIINSKNITL